MPGGIIPLMDNVQIPSPSAFLNSPAVPSASLPAPPLSPSQTRPPPATKRSSSSETVKANGATKPKQSKSRNGCVTCKSKRLKCDETKPSCHQCHKRNVECGGYKKDFKWRPFEESSFAPKATASKAKKVPSSLSVPKTSTVTERPLVSPAFSDVSSTAGSLTPDEQYIQQPPLPPTMQMHSSQTEFYHPDNGFLVDPSPYMLSPMGSRPMPRSHPGSFDTASAAGLSDSFEHVMTDVERSASSFSGRSPTLTDLLRPEINLCGSRDVYLDYQDTTSGMNTEDAEMMDGQDVEEILRDPTQSAAEWVLRLPSPSPSESSSSSKNSDNFNCLIRQPQLQAGSAEMLMLRFDKQTCGILSVKDGPTENPWRTLIWPLVHEFPALYHAIASMTAFHTAREIPALRVQGIEHMRRSIKSLRDNISTMRNDAALATTLVLAFSESWDVHITTGIEHLKGAKILVNQALVKHQDSSLTGESLARLKFLINTWVYMDVIARLTSVDVDESNDFDAVFAPPFGPVNTSTDIDPLMGCATSLFPLIGRVANLVRKARRSDFNSVGIISQGSQLKKQLEEWSPGASYDTPEDPDSEVRHSLQTAEAYRWATLLYLHQAVPELPSLNSTELARKVMVYLATVPLESRAVIVHIYPLLAAGCEATSPEDREWVNERWKAMSQRMWIGNIDRCHDVVREVWRRRDGRESERSTLHLPLTPAFSNSEASSPTDSTGQRKYSNDELSVGDNFPWKDSFGPGRRRATDTGPGRVLHVSQLRKKSAETYADESIDYETTVRGSMHWVGVMKDWKWEVLLG